MFQYISTNQITKAIISLFITSYSKKIGLNDEVFGNLGYKE